VEKTVEFSQVYKIINAIKEGDVSRQTDLDQILNDYKDGRNADSFLHEMGQKFLTIGMEELLIKTKSSELQSVRELTNKEWTEIAQIMIAYARKNKLSKDLSTKWEIPRREIDKHIINMARYITEGLIDSLE
tara:strand:- start:437 stop:832 length:396 start_codon:yes stop_codon:yes gene_type:complete